MLGAEANANFVDYAKRLARFLWTSKNAVFSGGALQNICMPPGAK